MQTILLAAGTLLVPLAVWEEAVEEGKRRMYEDAALLKESLERGGARVVEHPEK